MLYSLLAPFRNFVGTKFLLSDFDGYREFSSLISFLRSYFLNFTGLFCFISNYKITQIYTRKQLKMQDAKHVACIYLFSTCPVWKLCQDNFLLFWF